MDKATNYPDSGHRAYQEMQDGIHRTEEKVDRLLSIVEMLLGGIAEAQTSGGGMAGMVARQLPDATAILNNKG